MADRLLILGASARAAAASARRAGYEPVAIDLFADRDTKQICEAIRVPAEEYPEGLFRAARTMPKMPWMYTGGLENYPHLVGELAQERELWGNGPEVLQTVRGPKSMRDTLAHRGFNFPAYIPAGGEPPTSGKWLRKAKRSAGGRGVRFSNDSDIEDIFDSDVQYWLEEHIPGRPMSALFFFHPDWSDLFAMSLQLYGEPWLHTNHFQYCGNIGPAAKPEGILEFFLNFADAGQPDLSNCWGLDFIVRGNGVYPVEINPRYCASAEILELASGSCVLAPTSSVARFPQVVMGKAIYYAPASFAFPDSGPWDDSVAHAADVWRRPDFADVPHPGEVIEAGHPVITILTEADTEDACLARLKARATELDRLFGFPTPMENSP